MALEKVIDRLFEGEKGIDGNLSEAEGVLQSLDLLPTEKLRKLLAYGVTVEGAEEGSTNTLRTPTWALGEPQFLSGGLIYMREVNDFDVPVPALHALTKLPYRALA